jgi:hypothetical protein
MKRVVTLSAVLVLGGLGLATAQAGHGSGSSHSSQHSSNKQNNSSSSNSSKLKVYMGGSSSGPKGTPENPNKKDHCDHCDHNGCHDPKFPTIDPGKGDGKPSNVGVITDPIYPWAHPEVRDHRTGSTGGTMTNGNFVWAGDHWERAKATQTATNIPPLSGGNGQGGVTVTGGANLSGFGGGASNVRDHRTGGANGGVTVTPTQGSGRNGSIPTLSGPGPLDMLENGVSSLGSAIGGLFTTTVGDSGRPQVVDHRTSDTSNFGTNVRDHRTTDTSNFSSGGRGGK